MKTKVAAKERSMDAAMVSVLSQLDTDIKTALKVFLSKNVLLLSQLPLATR